MDGELRRALGRKEPSAGFADRVMQAVPAGVPAAPQMAVRRRPRYWVGLAAAASLAISIVGVRMWSEQQAIRRAERTRRDVEIALRLTGDKLNGIQTRLTALGARRTASHENAQQR
jgi:hypothetical protein